MCNCQINDVHFVICNDVIGHNFQNYYSYVCLTLVKYVFLTTRPIFIRFWSRFSTIRLKLCICFNILIRN